MSRFERSVRCRALLPWGAACVLQGADAICDVAACAGHDGACSPDGALACGAPGSDGGASDCGALGQSCVLGPDGWPRCLRQVPSCLPNTTVCDGDVAVYCVGTGVADGGGTDCGRLPGLTCDQGQCVVAAPSCEATARPSCEGDTLVFCSQTQQRELDCGELGLVCGDLGGTASCVLP